jgi:hypothetical protein
VGQSIHFMVPEDTHPKNATRIMVSFNAAPTSHGWPQIAMNMKTHAANTRKKDEPGEKGAQEQGAGRAKEWGVEERGSIAQGNLGVYERKFA